MNTSTNTSNRPPLLLIGAGGHAKVVLEEFKDAWDFQAVISDTSLSETQTAYFEAQGLEVLVESEELYNAFLAKNVTHAVIAVGDNEARQKIAEALLAAGFSFPNLIHPKALVASTAEISSVGVQILAGSHVGASASIGKHTIVNHHAIVEHDAVVGDAVHVAPHAVLLGGASLASGSLLGANATILPNVAVRANASIGAGGVVTKDIHTSGVYIGIPAIQVQS
ncbi:MAG: acetyltransferase [Vampirovibrionales bacterium]|jgi:sugar O-acyltransferase (sialic acid O-acetyltransferase NeuD family)|nr:acetyltransferase [Vampirovibrionales bacterium]